MPGDQRLFVNALRPQGAFLLGKDKVDQDLPEPVPDGALAFPLEAFRNADHAGHDPASFASVACFSLRVAAVVEEDPEDRCDARVGEGVELLDFQGQPVEVAVEIGGVAVGVVECDGQEEQTGHAGVFVDESDIPDPVVVIGQHSQDGMELCSRGEASDARSCIASGDITRKV